MLSLDLKAAAGQIGVAKRTLTEFEAGIRTLNVVTADKIQGFYRLQGIVFGLSASANDTVGFRPQVEEPLGPDVIKPKVETANLMDAHAVDDSLKELGRHLANLQEAARISRNVMHSIVADVGVERLEVAKRLGVTPSFISAILMGQKLLPISRAETIREILHLDADMKEAFLGERRLKKLLEGIGRLLAETSAEIEQISHSNQ